MKNYYSTLTDKGQLTIPTFIRNKMNLTSGAKLEFIIHDDYVILMPINKSASKLKGILPKPNHALSCEDMDIIIKDTYDRN